MFISSIWVNILLVTMFEQLAPSKMAIVQSRNDFHGLNLKLVDIKVRSSNDSDSVYADLNYLDNNSVKVVAMFHNISTNITSNGNCNNPISLIQFIIDNDKIHIVYFLPDRCHNHGNDVFIFP